jgi:hypothetical protein
LWDSKLLYVRAFIGLYRTAKWSVSGVLEGRHPGPLVDSTIRAAASSLAATFRDNLQPSPFHVEGGQNLHPSIRALFQAYDNVDPPANRQKAITPRLLRRLLTASGHPGIADTAPAVVADLVVAGFFFAMRSCEYSKPQILGRTRCVDLDGLVFRTESNSITPQMHRDLLTLATFVTVPFRNQKNGTKINSRTQRRTHDPLLCPVIRYTILVQRIYRTVANVSGSTTINTISTGAGRTGLVTNTYVLNILCNTCYTFGGKTEFGFDPQEIANKSVRSGAAMALFINDISTAKITILGRWSSDAFLVYIRPQVLEWTNNMSTDMIAIDSFFDVQTNHHTTIDDPRTRINTQHNPFNGQPALIPRLHLKH